MNTYLLVTDGTTQIAQSGLESALGQDAQTQRLNQFAWVVRFKGDINALHTAIGAYIGRQTPVIVPIQSETLSAGIYPQNVQAFAGQTKAA